MKTKSLTNLCHTLDDAFRRCARRFPVTLGFAFALTAYLCFQVATEGEAGEKKLLMTIGYFLSVGTLLSLSLHLWAEEVKRRKLRLGVQIVAPVLLALDAVFLYHNIEGTRAIDIGIAHGAALLAIGLSVFFLPFFFFRERDDIPAWNFAQTAVGTLALVVIVGAVMSGGLSLLVFSLHQLFGVEVSYKCYLYLLILCSLLLPLLMFLGLLPEGERKHDRQPQPTAFLQGAIRYLFVPLAALYLLVLYAYAGTILARWELPDGWVSWLVVALMHRRRTVSLAYQGPQTHGRTHRPLAAPPGPAAAGADDCRHRSPLPRLRHHAQPPLPRDAQRVVLLRLHRPHRESGTAAGVDTHLVFAGLPHDVGAACQLCRHHAKCPAPGGGRGVDTERTRPAVAPHRHAI